MREKPNPFLSRIIIAGEWDGNPSKAKALLEDVYVKWPKGRKVEFLMTCGGFIQFDWPKRISARAKRNWNGTSVVFVVIIGRE